MGLYKYIKHLLGVWKKKEKQTNQQINNTCTTSEEHTYHNYGSIVMNNRPNNHR